MTASQTGRDLRQLARLRGIQLSYTDNNGKSHRAPVDTLVGVLGALGYPVPTPAAITEELKRARHEREQQVLSPVIVRDRVGMLSAPIRLPRGVESRRCRIVVEREDGTVLDAEGGRVGDDLPPGYHRLIVEGPGLEASALLLVPPRLSPGNGLGVMAPVYALRGQDDWGIGSFADLADLVALAGSWGCNLVGSLPLFAASLGEPIDPSPYMPVSRLFWNELYVDMAGAAELAGCRSLDATRPQPRVIDAADVDYETVVRSKRKALNECAESIEAADGRRREDFEAFLAGHPELTGYADFRAAGDPTVARYHRFAQYAATTQLAHAAAQGARLGVGLYLDLPVGVHPNGYDTWAWPELFADAEVGAPPDALAAEGQAWGFQPLHPDALRTDGYSYFIAGLRHVLRFARAIRVDHILGLQRLYWIPPGADATTGAYVRYRDDELLAILAIEADRAGATVVGEDLGTVSPQIRHAMDDDGILHTYLSRFEATPANPLPQPRQPSAASLGSHDLPRFATFWRDPAQRELVAATGLAEPDRALRLCLESLAGGPAAFVFADLADLEGETVPDNRPGTGLEAGNWRHRLPRRIAELAEDESLRELMKRLADLRAEAAKKETKQ